MVQPVEAPKITCVQLSLSERDDVVCFIADYSARNAAPMRCGVNVTGLRQTEESIRWPGSPTCSPASPSILFKDSTNCSRGTGGRQPISKEPQLDSERSTRGLVGS